MPAAAALDEYFRKNSRAGASRQARQPPDNFAAESNPSPTAHCARVSNHGGHISQLDGQMVTDVYDMVLQEVEAPLLEAVLKYTRNNQTLASTVLGLNRGTLRKKLKRYGML
jgi:Fis family transcriptional regulator